jgi:hypothetical protein
MTTQAYLPSRPTFSNVSHAYVWAVVAFRLALDLSYALYVAPVFSDYDILGLALFVEFDFIRYIASFIFLIPVFFLPHDKKRFSSVFFLSATMFFYIPATSLWGLDSQRDLNGMIAMAVALLAAYAAQSFIAAKDDGEGRADEMRPLTQRQLITVGIAALFCIGFVLAAYVTDAIAGISFELSEIYLNREFQSERIDVGLLAYFNLWTQKIFSPLLLIVGLQRKNIFLIGFSLAMQLFFFGITQHRIHLFLPLIIFMVMQLYQRRIEISTVLFASAAFIVLALLASLVLQLEELPSILFRRTFFVPPQVSFEWISFFEDQRKIYWSDKLLEWLIPSSYNGMDPPTWLAWQISGRNFAFNSGIVGAGYSNAGYLGVLFYAMVLGALAGAVDNMVRAGTPIFMAAALLVGPFRTAWADSDLFAAFLSHGLLIGCIFLWLYSPVTKGLFRPTAQVKAPDTPVGAPTG